MAQKQGVNMENMAKLCLPPVVTSIAGMETILMLKSQKCLK